MSSYSKMNTYKENSDDIGSDEKYKLAPDEKYSTPRSSMVRILSEGQQLRLDIQHLRQEFETLLGGTRQIETEKTPVRLSCPKVPVLVPTSGEFGSTEERIEVRARSFENLHESEPQQQGLKDSVSSVSRQLPIVLDTPTNYTNRQTGLSSVAKAERRLVTSSSASKATRRRHSELPPPKQVHSASKINSRTSRRHSSAVSNRLRRSDSSDNNSEATTHYQMLRVSDTPSSEYSSQDTSAGSRAAVREIYKKHKRRLMAARRESGDGAPCEGTPAKYARLSGAYVQSVQSIISPMRRLPVKDRNQHGNGHSPLARATFDPQDAGSHWSRPQSMSTRRIDENSDRLKPRFFSMKSNSQIASRNQLSHDLNSPSNMICLPRPSPEGLINSSEGKPPKSSRCSCRRASCESEQSLRSLPQQNPFMGYYSQDTHPFRAMPNSAIAKLPTRYSKRQYPKTPMNSRPDCQLPYPMETIDENGLVHIVMTPEHYNQHMQQLMANQMSRDMGQGHGGHRRHHSRKVTASGLKDISRISNFSGHSHMHEQPSNIQVQGDFHSTFEYPLHSTMSYPLHSTLRNASLVPADDEGDEMSSIASEASPITPNKPTNKHLYRVAYQEHGLVNSKATVVKKDVTNVGVNTRDIAKALEEADDYSDVATPTNAKTVVRDYEVPSLPQTPAQAVNSYYTLSYDSDANTPGQMTPPSPSAASDCDSSCLSVDIDPKTPNSKSQKDTQQGNTRDLTMVTPTGQSQPCTHSGTVTCRCHFKSVRRMRPFGNGATRMRGEMRIPVGKEASMIFGGTGTVNFSESTVFMDSQLREIRPMDVSEISQQELIEFPIQTRNTNTVQRQENLCSFTQHETKANESNDSNNSKKSSIGETRGNLDFMSNLCQSIESLSDVTHTAVNKDSIKSSTTSARILSTVVEVHPLTSKPPTSRSVDVKRGTVDRHFLVAHPDKITTIKDNASMKQKQPTDVNNFYMAANQNVTMVADGCLGFFRKKKVPSAKKEKKPSKIKRFSLGRGSRVKPNLDFQEEDKENTPVGPAKRLLLPLQKNKMASAQLPPKIPRNEVLAPSKPTRQSAHLERRITSCVMVEEWEMTSVVTSHDSSSLSRDGASCLDYEMKRKLSKRMKEYRRSTISEHNGCQGNTEYLGHV